MFADYIETNRGPAINPGLERIRDCLDYLGNPQTKYKSVLITGTNGKGSVVFYLSNLACKSTDYVIGRYISPHLVSWNKRFVINETLLDSDYLENFSFRIIKKIEDFEDKSELRKLTTFEIYTVIAFCLFAEQNVDIAFLEIGMGGRLDATNIVDSKDVLCSVITSISLDHMQHLGDTIEKIAYEKAGIIKENNDIVTAVTGGALAVIKNEAESLKANLISLNTENLLYIEQNIETAVSAWRIISNKIKIKKTNLDVRMFLKPLEFPGRFQLLKECNILVDGAHNPAGAIELRKMLDKYYSEKRIIYILGLLNKDFKGFLNNLIRSNSTVICVEPKNERATNRNILADCLTTNACKTFICNGLQEAVSEAQAFEHDLILVTGSLYLVGEMLELIQKKQIKEPVCIRKHH